MQLSRFTGAEYIGKCSDSMPFSTKSEALSKQADERVKQLRTEGKLAEAFSHLEPNPSKKGFDAYYGVATGQDAVILAKLKKSADFINKQIGFDPARSIGLNPHLSKVLENTVKAKTYLFNIYLKPNASKPE
jgi:hypothetical protein